MFKLGGKRGVGLFGTLAHVLFNKFLQTQGDTLGIKLQSGDLNERCPDNNLRPFINSC